MNADRSKPAGETRPVLLGLSPAEIAGLLAEAPFPAYRAKQVVQWIYAQKAASFDAMSNLSLADRAWLNQHFLLGNLPAADERVSADGTRKYLFNISEADEQPAYVECVYIPDGDRATLCVSSQSGCRMNCRFCATGGQGFNRSLSAAQILNQFYSLPFADEISSFVFMGMGEPFDNTDEVLRALGRLTAADGFAFSPRRITVSTVGVIPGMKRFLDESECHLAVSLHSPFADERAQWIPAQNAYPMADVLDVLKHYDFRHQRRLSFEYILFGGLNDSLRHAKALVKLLSVCPGCRVNLILYHPVPGKPFQRPKPEQAFLFRDYLSKNGLFATLRQSRGEDIEAACGLLSQQKKGGKS